jgi:polyhydroxybutyrate depolymerase
MLGLGDESGRPRVAPSGAPWLVVVALMVLGCASAPVGDGTGTPMGTGDPRRVVRPQPSSQPSSQAALAVTTPPGQAQDVATARPAGPNPTASSHHHPLPGPQSPLLARRPYQLHRPQAVAAGTRLPLFIYLHGLGASGRRLLSALDLAPFADTKQVFIVAPDGTVDSQGRRFWNASGACCDFDGSGVDDVAYLTALINDLRTRQPVDPKRIFVVGYSNGGFMAHRLACELSDHLAGIASFSGAAYDDSKCAATRPVTILQVHGDADRTVRYGGGHVLSLTDLPAHPSAPASVAGWAARNGCSASLKAVSGSNLRTGDKPTTVQRHLDCRHSAVELWTVQGGGHLIGMQRPAIEATFTFLLAHPKP